MERKRRTGALESFQEDPITERLLAVNQCYLQLNKLPPKETEKENCDACADQFRMIELLYQKGPLAVRFKIVSILPTFRMRRVREILEHALREDDSPLVRHEAAFGLGVMGDTEAVPTLVSVGASGIRVC